MRAPGYLAGLRIAAVLVGALVLVSPGLLADTSSAAWPFMSSYTRSGSSCTNHLVDPINVIFDGPHGYPSKGKHLMERYGGWFNRFGSEQSIWTQHRCNGMNGQRADDCEACNRDHMRFFGSHYVHTGRPEMQCGSTANPGCELHHYTGGDAHYDYVVLCGHIVQGNGYNRTRGAVLQALYAHVRRMSFVDWGNSGHMRQCNGSRPHSDGRVLWVQVH